MSNQSQYRASKSRITKQQESYNQIQDQIAGYIKNLTAESDAGTIWMGLKSEGVDISISSFNTRLKKLVEAGLVEKRLAGYNKYFYI